MANVVVSRAFTLTIVIAVIVIFEANAQPSALGLGYRHEANPQQIRGSYPGDQLGRFLVGREIPRLWVGQSYNKDPGYGGQVVEDHCNRRQHWR